MVIALLCAALVGVSIVAQGSVNAQLLRTSNLWLLLTIGNVVCLVGTLVAFFVTRSGGGVGEELARVSPRVVIPSLCGLVITAGMPMAIGRAGVFTAVTVVIGVQLLAGLLWGHFTVTEALSAWRVLGAVLVFLGGVLVTRG